MKCVCFNERFNRLYFLDLKAEVKGQKPPPKVPKAYLEIFSKIALKVALGRIIALHFASSNL